LQVAKEHKILRSDLIAVQGHPRSSTLVAIESACFLVVTSSNFGFISYSFRDIDEQSYKIARFPHPTLVWCPRSEEARQNFWITLISQN